jgi:hypothetical protein
MLFRCLLLCALALTDGLAEEAETTKVDFVRLAQMLSQGETAEAAQWLRTGWERFDWLHTSQEENPPLYEATFAKAAKDLRVELEDDHELAFYAEALLGGLANAEETPSRRSRLSALAKRVGNVVWKEPQHKAAALSLIGLEVTAAKHFTEHYARVGQAISLKNLQSIKDDRSRHCQHRLLQIYGRQSLAVGPDVVKGQLEHLLSPSFLFAGQN